MGWSLTVQCFEHGTFSTFPRSIAWNVFGPYANPAAFSGWDLRFPDGSKGHLSMDDDILVDGFGFDRPSGLALYEAIFAVLSRVPAIMIWLEDGRCAIADRSVLSGIPQWLLNALPPPAIVDSGQSILDYLERSAGG